MSMLPTCTCSPFSAVFGQYDPRCARHWSSAKWWAEKMEQRAAALRNLRTQAITRPIHGGYPDGGVPDAYSGPAMPHGVLGAVMPDPKGGNDGR